jgi:hypothetical protein
MQKFLRRSPQQLFFKALNVENSTLLIFNCEELRHATYGWGFGTLLSAAVKITLLREKKFHNIREDLPYAPSLAKIMKLVS